MQFDEKVQNIPHKEIQVFVHYQKLMNFLRFLFEVLYIFYLYLYRSFLTPILELYDDLSFTNLI